MDIPKEEVEHQISVLYETINALSQKNSLTLMNLSNQTLHCSVNYQNQGSLDIAVILYTLSKIIERKDYEKIKRWDTLVDKISALFNLTIIALKQNNQEKYEEYLAKVRVMLTNTPNKELKRYLSEVMKKASINKASRIYEHGLSLEKSAKISGLTQWELSEYANQRKPEIQPRQLNEKQRAKIALEFFS